MKEIELKKLRKRREKHFLQEDGTIIAKVYGEDIHFKKGNEYKEINNTLIKENDYYTNTNNQYKVMFKENSIDSFMKIEEDNNFLEINLLDSNNVPIIKRDNTSKLTDSVIYEEVLNGVDLEYKVLPAKVKENIIIKNKNFVPNKLCFSIKTNLQLEIDNKVILAKNNDKIIFSLDAPYMIDANGNYNREIYYNLNKATEGYKLELIMDEEWLDKAIYPVIIDPTITNEIQNNSVNDVYIYPGDTGIDRNSQDILKVGVERINNQNIINRTLIKFDLPTIATGDQVISAYFTLVGYATEPQSYESDIVNVHRVTEDWNETNATWNGMNDKFDSRVEASFDSIRSYTETFEIIGESYLYPILNGADITSLVKKWYSGLDNNGILLKANKEVYRNDIIPAFYSKNNVISSDDLRPLLSITYRNQNGLEDYMDYKKQSFSNGNAYVNSYNGNLTTIFDLGKTINGKLPVNLSLIYNTNDVLLNNDIGLGKGYKLNYQQTIKESNIENYLEYLDADGTIHYFKYIDGIYKDEDGLNMTINIIDNKYILRDKNNNEMVFVKNNQIGYLTEIKDVSENKILINYNSNNLITKIVDANLNEINLIYENDKISIISPDKSITLNRSDNKITNLTTITGVTSFNYNENNIISNIIDETGRKISYEYYSQIPHRVKKVVEYGTENTIGHFFDITYNFNSTTMIDEKNRVCTLTFNNKGNLISVSNLSSSNDIKNAYGKKYDYDETIESDYYINPIKNKLLSVDIPNRYVKNYLNNTSFESNNINFLTNDTLNMEITNEMFEFGLNSLKITNVDPNNCIFQNINVPKGNDYTFSVYIKNSSNVKIALSYIGENNEIIENSSNIINSSEFFERHDVTINYPFDAISELSIKIYLLETGTTYIDGIQLEEGEVCNNYNMLENSDFSNGLIDWIISAEDSKTFEPLSATDYFEIVNINENNDKALKIKMDPAVISSFEKKYYVNGKAGDVYNISFWYKNEAFPTTGLEGDTVYNDMMIFYNYLDQSEGHGLNSFTFNPNDTNWQYFTQNFMAEKDFDYLEVRFFQGKNANNFYITNMCLFKDVRSIDYEYDENGNIKKSKSLNSTVTEFGYNENNQLIKMINPKGTRVMFEYDNLVTDRIINSISNLGISNKIKYDSFGNPISTKLIKNNLSGDIVDGLYRIRLKGTEEYLRNINNELQLCEDECGHDLWNLTTEGEYCKINHSIIDDKYLIANSQNVLLGAFDNDNSLFSFIRNENGSYHIKSKSCNNYIKANDSLLELTTLVEDDYHFEFYIETTDSDMYVENDAEYTSDGRFIKNTVDSLFNKIIYNVDNDSGLTTSVINTKGQIAHYNYNDKKQLISVNCENKFITFDYNNKNLLSQITHGNKKYKFYYNEFLKLQSIKLGDNITLITKIYEENNGNLLSNNYGNSQMISFEYDNFDRIKKLIKSDDVYNYKYGNNGDLIKILSNYGIKKYTYDLGKRLAEYNFNDFKVNYKYDDTDNVINIKYSYNDIVNNVNNIYNEDDSIIKMSIDENEFNYSYDEIGRLINANINNSYNIQYDYLRNGNRTSFIIKSINNNGDVYSYKYDKLNNIKNIYHNNKLENSYKYDEYNQLIEEKNYLLGEVLKYKYDENGNILTKQKFDLNSYNFISENKFDYNNTSWEDQLTKIDDKIITYDNIGNPLTIGDEIALSWINGRELHAYNDLNNTIIYKYDDEGIRISKTINNVETKYCLQKQKIILEQTGSNVLYYIYNNVGDLIGFKYNKDIYYYLKNVQNDIVGILNSNYTIIARYTYDAWGNILSIVDNNGNDISNSEHIANINPFRYRSYYYDKETKLYYLNNRYYNPLIGRFINADPIIGSNEDIISYNLYVYASNNPVNNIDPDGLGIFKKAWNALYDFGKKISKPVRNFIEKVKNAFVFEVGVGVGIGADVNVGVGGTAEYSKDMTYKIENGKSSKGSTTSAEFTVNAGKKEAGIAKSYYHEYHNVPGDLDATINHTHILPFVNQIDDCEYTETTTTIMLKTTKTINGVVETDDNTTFVGLELGAHLGIGGHIKIGFNIQW